MKKMIIRISILMIIFCGSLWGQLQMKMSTNKDVYDYGETIHIYCSVTNITDTTFKLITPSWESCDAQFQFNDYYSGEWTACLASLKKVSYPPHTTKIFKWTIDPQVFGLPNKDGEQRIIGDYSYGVGDIWDYTYDEIRDTIFIQAPEYLGGQVSVKFSVAKDSLVSLLKDILEVEVLESKIFDNFYYEKWQVTGYNIDSLANFLNNDNRINYVWLERNIQYDSVYVTSAKDYYPLSVGNKWVYGGGGSILVGSPNDPWFEGYSYNILKQIIDTIRVNDKIYYKVIEKVSYDGSFPDSLIYFERYDSKNCCVYVKEYYEDLNTHDEYPNFRLCTEIGDTVGLVVDIPRVYFDQVKEIVNFADSLASQFDQVVKKKYYQSANAQTRFTLAEGFGLTAYYNSHQFGTSEAVLKGCIIDGVIYGDTSLIVSVEDEEESLPNEISLSQNYPNPFNPTTKIKFTIATSPFNPSPYQGEGQRERLVSLIVYDILGREVKTLLNKPMQPGSYEVEFDGSDLPSGAYFYRLSSGNSVETKKMLLIK